MRYYEDFTVGEITDLGPVSVSEEEIVEFASRYDPQAFHIDPEAATSSPFGGLIASTTSATSAAIPLRITRTSVGFGTGFSPGGGREYA
jgi:acyl dehydratase